MTGFEREFAKRLDELRRERTEVITQTVLTQDDYMRQMGYFQCLRDIVAMCEDIRDEIIKS
jgi:hypothetical protein